MASFPHFNHTLKTIYQNQPIFLLLFLFDTCPFAVHTRQSVITVNVTKGRPLWSFDKTFISQSLEDLPNDRKSIHTPNTCVTTLDLQANISTVNFFLNTISAVTINWTINVQVLSWTILKLPKSHWAGFFKTQDILMNLACLIRLWN